jgi:uncharacterized protein with PIN domain
MMTILNLYETLYERLRGAGVDYLIEQIKGQNLTDYYEEALRIIARLPHPSFASVEQIFAVCKECSAGHLEFAFNTEQIGEIARRILSKDNEYKREEKLKIPKSFPPSPGVYDVQSIGMMLKWSNAMMRHLVQQTDIILKGRCPYCAGDLVEDIVPIPNCSTNKYELRLRCRQQATPNCRNVDWYIQDVIRR